MDGLHGRVRLGVEREAAAGDRQPPKIRSSVGGIRGVGGDLSVRLHQRVLGAPSGVGRCVDGSRSRACIHLHHVLRWGTGESSSAETHPEPNPRGLLTLLTSAACSSNRAEFETT